MSRQFGCVICGKYVCVDSRTALSHERRVACTVGTDGGPVPVKFLLCESHGACCEAFEARLRCIWCRASVPNYDTCRGSYLRMSRAVIGDEWTQWFVFDVDVIECKTCLGKAARSYCTDCYRWSTDQYPVTVDARGLCPNCGKRERRRQRLRELVRGQCDGVMSDDEDDEFDPPHDADVQPMGAALLCSKCRSLAKA